MLTIKENTIIGHHFMWQHWMVILYKSIQADFDLWLLICNAGSLDIVRFLFKNGADVNAKEVHGYTPVYLAALKGTCFGILSYSNRNNLLIGFESFPFLHFQAVWIWLSSSANMALMSTLRKKKGEHQLFWLLVLVIFSTSILNYKQITL